MRINNLGMSLGRKGRRRGGRRGGAHFPQYRGDESACQAAGTMELRGQAG